MLGSNCAIYGCSTSRKEEDVGIFKLPTAKDPETAKWRSDMFSIITKDRVLDNHLKQLYAKFIFVKNISKRKICGTVSLSFCFKPHYIQGC